LVYVARVAGGRPPDRKWGRFVSGSRHALIGRRVTRCVVAAGVLVFTLGVAHAAPVADAKKRPAPPAKPVAAAPALPGLTLENAVPVTIPTPARLQTRATPAPVPSLSSYTPMDIPVVEAPVARPAPAPMSVAKQTVSPKFDATPQPVASTLPPREPPPRVEVAAVPSAAAPTPAPTLAPLPTPVVPDASRIEIPPLPEGALTLRFTDDAGALERESDALIATLAVRMQAEPTMRLSLRSYARAGDDPRDARKTSLRRATAVREKLISLGVRQTRVDLRALGAPPATDKPADRIEIDVIAN